MFEVTPLEPLTDPEQSEKEYFVLFIFYCYLFGLRKRENFDSERIGECDEGFFSPGRLLEMDRFSLIS